MLLVDGVAGGAGGAGGSSLGGDITRTLKVDLGVCLNINVFFDHGWGDACGGSLVVFNCVGSKGAMFGVVACLLCPVGWTNRNDVCVAGLGPWTVERGNGGTGAYACA